MKLRHAFVALVLSTSAVPLKAENIDNLIEKQRASFSQCLIEKAQQAKEDGVSAQRIENEFTQLKFVPRVLELDRSQPEFVSTFPDYYNKRVNQWRIDKGREKFVEHRSLLRQLTDKYGIPGHYLMAFWGLETNYGGYKGQMSTLDVLATLACDARRSAFFSKELFLALKLMDREGFDKAQMYGSWAGAMGHTQFMPSSYTQYAIDGDGDGVANLWESEADALTSAANFLHKLGWKAGIRWGREVLLPEGFDFNLANAREKTVTEWHALGIKRSDSKPLGNSDIQGKLIVPAGFTGPAFLAYDNYNIIRRWNNSQSYAIAVGRLATRINGGGELVTPLPEVPTLSIAKMMEIQRYLNQLGFDVGGADGVMGPATRDGLRRFQEANGLIADGFPSSKTIDLLTKLSSD